jgi:anti-sigma-K factor RskA
MNLNELQERLTAAARRQTPNERVPYAFEKRVMAHIAARAVTDRWVVWGNSLWRAAVSCVAVAIVCGGISLWAPQPTDNGNDLSQDLDNTLLASADQADTTP